MAILKVKEIRNMSPEERRKKLEELRAELIVLRTQARVAGGTVANPSRIKEIRRTIARILTIEKEEQMKQKQK
ncbi:MAG: 50S ribosomal protein L29 [Thermoprotei archaeon]|nr:50S ribosomal protein L29 [Thermoproteales archaeon]RLE74246.1 MAG: 50S ribosomal protein L29 [Thermoprotei archaeon]RLE77612.1 MAG: 50S ribosomal protein L29 [Thermoprotei archaeon]RLE84545.1 MAG: 50S ribosomal protein L29 [Thermoprotei archaeon]